MFQPLEKVSPDLALDVGVLIEASYGLEAEKCDRGAPFIFFEDHQGILRIVQGCCNGWTCGRCGQIRARTEYGRIVAGATILGEQREDLYFHTWTCLGDELPLADAEAHYGLWTNRMLNSMRDQNRRIEGLWAYAQVTERQTRMHPHSHLITTFLPEDARLTTVLKRGKDGVWREREVYLSAWYEKKLKKAGLGSQYEITHVRDAVAVGVYMAKYMFKDAIFTEWPPKWKRVRYSQSWPKNPDHKPPEICWPLLKQADWVRVKMLNRPVHVDSQITAENAKRRGLTRIVA